MIARRVRVTGRVQGVGFRWATRAQARALGVTGWVRNRIDGTVEACVQGATEPVREMVNWLRCGPSHARVDECEVIVDESRGSSTSFEIRH